MRSVRFEARPQGMLKLCRPDFPAPHGSWPPCRRPAGPPYPRAIRPPGRARNAGPCRVGPRPATGGAGQGRPLSAGDPRRRHLRSDVSTKGKPRHAATVRTFTPVTRLGYVTFGAAHRPAMGAAGAGFPSGGSGGRRPDRRHQGVTAWRFPTGVRITPVAGLHGSGKCPGCRGRSPRRRRSGVRSRCCEWRQRRHRSDRLVAFSTEPLLSGSGRTDLVCGCAGGRGRRGCPPFDPRARLARVR
jgi:hypothetical protein